MLAKFKATNGELQRRKTTGTSEVGDWACNVVTGYYQRHAVPGRGSVRYSGVAFAGLADKFCPPQRTCAGSMERLAH